MIAAFWLCGILVVVITFGFVMEHLIHERE